LSLASIAVNLSSVRLIQQIDECCPVLLEAPLGSEEARQLASALKVLADPARLRLVSLIAAQPGAEACVCNLTRPLGLSQPTVSHHLRVLTDAGVLDRERRGRWAYYRLNQEPLDVLARALSAASAAAASG
jgi:ArsR family transcriptional regulator